MVQVIGEAFLCYAETSQSLFLALDENVWRDFCREFSEPNTLTSRLPSQAGLAGDTAKVSFHEFPPRP